MTEQEQQEALCLDRMRLARRTAGRAQAGYSQATMALALGMSKSWVSEVERGKVDVSAGHVAMWANITSRRVSWLFGGE